MADETLHRRYFNYHTTNGSVGEMTQDYILKDLQNLIELKEMLGSDQLQDIEQFREEIDNKDEYYLDNDSIVSITELNNKRQAIVETAIYDKQYPLNVQNQTEYGENNYVQYLANDISASGFPLMSHHDGDIRSHFNQELRVIRNSYLNLLGKHSEFTQEQNFGKLRLLINEPLYVTNVLQRGEVGRDYTNNSERLNVHSQFGGKRFSRDKLRTTFDKISPNTMVYTPISHSFQGRRSDLAKFYTQNERISRVYNNLAIPNIYGNTKLCLGTTSFTRQPSNPSKIQNSIHDFLGGVFNSDLSMVEMPLINFKEFVQQAKMNFIDQDMLDTIPNHIKPFKRDIISYLDDYLNFLGAIEEYFKQEYVTKKETFIGNYLSYYSMYENVNITHVRDFYESLETGEFEPIYQNAYMILLISNLTSTPLDIMYKNNTRKEEVLKKGLFIFNNGEYVLR